MKNKDRPTAALSNSQHQEKREEETEEEKNDVIANATTSGPAAIHGAPAKSIFRPEDFALADRITAAQGLDKHHPSAIGTAHFANKWLSEGWQPDLIVRTVERVMARRTEPPKSLRYFEQAIADAHADLARPLPLGVVTGPPGREHRKSYAELAIEFETRAKQREQSNPNHIDVATIELNAAADGADGSNVLPPDVARKCANSG